MKYLLYLLTVYCFCLLFCGCRLKQTQEQKQERAFYFWKSALKLTAFEHSELRALQVKKIYIKFFDVVNDPGNGSPVPVAKLSTDPATIDSLKTGGVLLTPTIFITNETFRNLDSPGTKTLAWKVVTLFESMLTSTNLRDQLTNEIQFDCDWTAVTKDMYFYFLQEYRRLTIKDRRVISATIRLYQSKYLLKTGVPPVDRGLLMCYNMGNLRDPVNNGNSIFDLAEMEKYTSSLSVYPLDLDIALPLFDWMVLIRNNAFAGLIPHLPEQLLDSPEIASRNGNIYTILQDITIVGYSLKRNDRLRVEESKYDDIMRAGKLLSKRLKSTAVTISLYHLDSTTLSKYTTDELENIYNSLH